MMTYDIYQWQEEPRKVLMKAGLKQKYLMFLSSDIQLVHGTMLEDLRNVLLSGDSPNLCDPGDLNQIFTRCRLVCVNKEILPTKIDMLAQYLILVRQTFIWCYA